MLTTVRQTIQRGVLLGLGLLIGCGMLLSQDAQAQQRYYPLDQMSPPGMYGAWSGYQQAVPQKLQAVRIDLPCQGTVTFFSEARQPSLRFNTAEKPAQAAVALGRVYRLQLSNLADYPELSLYPTIELVGVLHPPQGREDEFPIPVALTDEEISLAREGRLVTKVVYLEPANEANPITINQENPSLTIPSRYNVLEEADRRGRPMLILRVGGRIPMPDEDPAFFGNGAPLSESVNPRTR